MQTKRTLSYCMIVHEIKIFLSAIVFTKHHSSDEFCISTTKPKIVHTVVARDVEAMEYFLLPLPAPYKVSRFWVCFHFQFLSSKCFSFHKNLTASTSLLHVLWKMLPLSASQKVKLFRVCFHFQLLSSKCFRFHKNLTTSTSLVVALQYTPIEPMSKHLWVWFSWTCQVFYFQLRYRSFNQPLKTGCF